MTLQIVPESAPFSSEQRAWLNGFLAGMIGLIDSQQTALGGSSGSLAAAATMLTPPWGSVTSHDTNESSTTGDAEASEEEMPWHDAALAIQDRMELAKDRPPERRLMAAMAQLDCGSCGYLCKTYAESIANGQEKNLTLCSPGGNETAKMLRKLVKESKGGGPANGPVATAVIETNNHAVTDSKSKGLPAPGTRENPVTATLQANIRLNGAESAKDTRHIEIDLKGTSLSYRVGDALGLLPTNCESLVRKVIEASKIDWSDELHRQLEAKCLRSISTDLVERAIERVNSRPKVNGSIQTDASLAKAIEEFSESEEFDKADVADFLEAFPNIGITANDLTETLQDIRPRLYSIASSQVVHANAVHLTVGRVENVVHGRARKGVASTMLADRLEVGSPVRVFVHPSHGFTTPSDPSVPMIMVGPGTGIAPFIAFLQQREADRALGKNWLFFGDQKQSTDFLYQQQLEAWHQQGHLTKLDLAFSRDSDKKVYVQHRMKENGEELFRWLEQGAYFFVCGDAARMAADVDLALKEVIAQHSNQGAAFAQQYVTKMTQQKRYVRDVY